MESKSLTQQTTAPNHPAVTLQKDITIDPEILRSEEVVQSEEGQADKREYISGTKKALILGPITLVYFLVFLDIAIVSTATPSITSQFNALLDVGWYGGAYQLGSAAFQPLTGKIYRYFSIKWSYLVFFAIFEIGSLLCGAATSSPMFIVGRVIAGVGSSGISNGTLTIIGAVLPTRDVAKFMGLNMGLGQLGLALGPILGGLFSEYVSWRWCFYINLPPGGVVAALLLFMKIPEPETKPPPRQVIVTAVKSLDLIGFTFICPAVVMFLLALQFGGNQYAWNSSVVIGLLVGASLLFGLFLFWEQRQGDSAMVPFAMLRQRIIWSASANMFFLLASILIGDFYLGIYFQAVHDDSPFMSGVHMLPLTIAMVLFTALSGMLTGILGYYLPWALEGAAASAVGYGLLTLLSPSTPAAHWIGYLVLYGVGAGSMIACSFLAIQALVPSHQIPTAMAIALFCQNIGGSVSLLAANAIFTNALRHSLASHTSTLGFSPDEIINAGVRSLRNLVGTEGEKLRIVLQAYCDGVDKVMYLGVGTAVAAFVFAWGLGWKDIRIEKKLVAIQEKRREEREEEEKEKKEGVEEGFKGSREDGEVVN